MSTSYRMKIIRTKENRLFRENVYQVNNKKKNNVLEYDQIRNIHRTLMEKKGADDRIIIRALGPIGWITLTRDSELNLLDGDDYFEGRVREPEKLQQFFQIQLHVIKANAR